MPTLYSNLCGEHPPPAIAKCASQCRNRCSRKGRFLEKQHRPGKRYRCITSALYIRATRRRWHDHEWHSSTVAALAATAAKPVHRYAHQVSLGFDIKLSVGVRSKERGPLARVRGSGNVAEPAACASHVDAAVRGPAEQAHGPSGCQGVGAST
jgi:hypothetical protein